MPDGSFDAACDGGRRGGGCAGPRDQLPRPMRLLVALLLVIPALAALGQDGRSDLAVHTVYVEVLGNAMPGTLNIDVLVADRFALRFGGILLPLVDEEGDLIGDEHYTPQDLSFAAGTVMVSRLYGQGAVRLEVGEHPFASAG